MNSRWSKAQAYERSWWERKARMIEGGAVGAIDRNYAWKAQQMEEKLRPFLQFSTGIEVLEIGGGPIANVSALSWGRRFAIDPLNDFYATHQSFSAHRPAEVTYLTGTGEDLPFEDNRFSLVILENVLDHVHSASKVLSEIHRVLVREGVLYFTVNIRTRWGTNLHRLVSAVGIDKGHPYSFTHFGIRRFLENHAFAIRAEWVEDRFSARNSDRNSGRLRDKVKGYTGLTEFVFSAVLQRQVSVH